MKKLKKNRGITLIALVITIIVLLILAGISIQILTGSGIFEKAKQAIEKSKYAGALEKIKLAVTASYDESGNINNEFLKDNLNAIKGKEGELVENENDITVKVDGYLFQVSKSTGEITKKDVEIADGGVDNSREIDEEEYNLLKEKVEIMSNTIDMLKNDTYTKAEADSKFTTSDSLTNEYSTIEKLVGKWINGKDLYQKTYSITTPSSVKTWENVADISNLNYDTIFIVNGFIITSVNEILPLWYHGSSTDFITNYINTNNTKVTQNSIFLLVSLSDYINKQGYITVQYTKK